MFVTCLTLYTCREESCKMRRQTILSRPGPLPNYIYRFYVEFFRSGRIPSMAALASWDHAITAETFKKLAAKMKLCGSILICVATGLPMVSQEKFEFLVVKVHTRGGHPGPGHRGILSTCITVRRKYSIGEVNFGITEAEVRRISLRCPDPDCTHRLWKQKFTTGRWLDVKPMVFHKHKTCTDGVVTENVSQQQPLGAIDLTIEPARTDLPLDLSQNRQLVPDQVNQSMQWCIGLGSPLNASFEDETEVITIDSSPEVIDSTSDTASATESTIGDSSWVEEREYVDLDDLKDQRPADSPLIKANNQTGKTKPVYINLVETNNIQDSLRIKRVAQVIRTPSEEKTPALIELLCLNVTKPAQSKVPARHTQRCFVDLIHVIHSMRGEVPKTMLDNEKAAERLKNKIERALEIIVDATHGETVP